MFNLYNKIANFSDIELLEKIKSYQNSNIAFIILFIITRIVNRILHAGSCIPHTFTLNSIVACGTVISFIVQILGFIFLIMLMIKGIKGIKLSKAIRERFPEKKFLLLKLTSYLLILPLILEVATSFILFSFLMSLFPSSGW